MLDFVAGLFSYAPVAMLAMPLLVIAFILVLIGLVAAVGAYEEEIRREREGRER